MHMEMIEKVRKAGAAFLREFVHEACSFVGLLRLLFAWCCERIKKGDCTALSKGIKDSLCQCWRLCVFLLFVFVMFSRSDSSSEKSLRVERKTSAEVIESIKKFKGMTKDEVVRVMVKDFDEMRDVFSQALSSDRAWAGTAGRVLFDDTAFAYTPTDCFVDGCHVVRTVSSPLGNGTCQREFLLKSSRSFSTRKDKLADPGFYVVFDYATIETEGGGKKAIDYLVEIEGEYLDLFLRQLSKKLGRRITPPK